MGLLDNNRFLPVGSSVLTANESVSIASANTNLKTIPYKKGYGCVAITLETSSPTAVLCVRIGNTANFKQMVSEDGELHYRIDYYNNLRYVAGNQLKTYYLQPNAGEELRLFNVVAVTGGTATITIAYLQDFPKCLETLKPRQILYRKAYTFGSGESTFNEKIGTNIVDSELTYILRFFKYVAVEMIFLNSSNAKKSVSGTFKLIGLCYLPETSNTTSGMAWTTGEAMIDATLTSVNVFDSDMVEAKGYGIRYETNLGDTVSEGDKVIMNIIGIR